MKDPERGSAGNSTWRERAQGDAGEERRGEQWRGEERRGGQRSPKEWKKGGREVPVQGCVDWLHAPVLQGGRGWLNKQS